MNRRTVCKVKVVTSSNIETFEKEVMKQVDELQKEQFDVEIQYNPVLNSNSAKIRYSSMIIGTKGE